MKLKPTHFYDPEPHQDQFLDSSDMDHPEYNMEAFNQAHSAWKARQVKPKFLDFTVPQGVDSMTAWEYDELHRKALQHYEENRLRYKGFELNDNIIENEEL